jgi:3-oxoacyl-[acyl-carrier-protein] synthase-3
MVNAYLSGIEYYLPEGILDNASIEAQHPEWSVDKISAKTGIAERHIAGPAQYSSDLAVCAAERLFCNPAISRSEVDYLLLCTQSPDYFLPTTACILQERLSLSKGIGALDFNLGCSGFVYGMGLAKGLIVSGQARRVLLITAETYSKFIHPDDKSNKTIFGDAAAAVLVSADKTGDWAGTIMDFQYGTDGGGHGDLIVKNGGMRDRYTMGSDIMDEETGAFLRNDSNLHMDGKAIFNFTAFHVPGLIKDTLQKHALKMEDIDLFVFHQANEFMLQTLRKRCGIPVNKFYIYMRGCGNTVSSTIPIALKHALNDKAITPGNKVLAAGFGVGLSMGATILQF